MEDDLLEYLLVTDLLCKSDNQEGDTEKEVEEYNSDYDFEICNSSIRRQYERNKE